MDDNSKSILAAIIYYDIQNFPLTLNELKRVSISPLRFGSGKKFLGTDEIKRSLALLCFGGLIEEKSGFFLLRGRAELYEKRIEKKKIADQKWKKTIRALKWLQAVPFVQAVFASGSLALGNTEKDSDLDILVVSRAGRIWTCRFFVSLAMSLLKMRRRRHDTVAPDKVCLNHYITDKSLFIPFHSLYNAQTYAHLIPVWAKNPNIIRRFEDENGWVSDFINYWRISGDWRFRIVKNNRFLINLAGLWERILDSRAGDFVELRLKRIQHNRIVRNPDYLKPGGRVTADDAQLEFHPDSPEKNIIEKFNKNISSFAGFENYREVDSGLR